MSSIIDRVQALGFLDDLRNRKIRILPEANKIAVMERIDGGKYSLADALGDALGELEDSRPYDAVGLGHPLSANRANSVIAKAYAHGVVVDTNFEELQEQLMQKDEEIQSLRQKNAEQESDLAKLSQQVIHWQSRYDEVDRRLRGMFKHNEEDGVSNV